MRLALDENVNICIIDMSRLQGIIEAFEVWRKKVLKEYDETAEVNECSAKDGILAQDSSMMTLDTDASSNKVESYCSEGSLEDCNIRRN